jgi:hypothetical protein
VTELDILQEAVDSDLDPLQAAVDRFRGALAVETDGGESKDNE